MSRPERSAAIAFAVVAMVSGCAPATSDWVKQLNNPDPFRRVMAAVALGEVEPKDSPEAVIALVRALDREQSDFRPRVVSVARAPDPPGSPDARRVGPLAGPGPRLPGGRLRDALEEGREHIVPLLVASLGDAGSRSTTRRSRCSAGSGTSRSRRSCSSSPRTSRGLPRARVRAPRTLWAR
jgi:hypothetical protein